MLNSAIQSWISPIRNRLNSRAGISQAICALTSLLSSAVGPFALEGLSFTKWILYTTGFFLIQSFQRSIYLDNHLLDNAGMQSRRYWDASSWTPFLILSVPLINFFALGYKLTSLDLLLILSFYLSLLQDRFRYLFLAENPKIPLIADLLWLLSSAVFLLTPIVLSSIYLADVFLIQMFVCPALGIIPLLLKARNLKQHKAKLYKLDSATSKYLGYIRFQFVFGAIVAMFFSVYVVKHLSIEELKMYKIIQTIISPYQSFANILGISIYASRLEKSLSNEFLSVMKFCRHLFLLQVFCSVINMVLYHIFRNYIQVWFSFSLPEISLLGVALIGPISMLSAIPLSAFMRRNRMGREILISGLMGSLFLILLISNFNLDSNLFGILFTLSASAFLTVVMSFLLTAIKTRNGRILLNVNN